MVEFEEMVEFDYLIMATRYQVAACICLDYNEIERLVKRRLMIVFR